MSTRIIKVNRGDSLELVMTIPSALIQSASKEEKKLENYKLKATDALYFAVLYHNQPFGDHTAPICRGYSGSDPEVNGDKITITLTHSDTNKLDPGVYYYTTKVQIGGSVEDLGASEEPKEVRTIIERTKFIVNE